MFDNFKEIIKELKETIKEIKKDIMEQNKLIKALEGRLNVISTIQKKSRGKK